MEAENVISLAAYKAERFYGAKQHRHHLETSLPEPQRLWELLDKNISVQVWNHVTNAQR